MPASPAALRRKAVWMLVLCTAFWGLSFPGMKTMAQIQGAILPGAGTWFTSSLDVMVRFAVAGVLLLLFVFREFRTVSRREVEQGMVMGFFTTAGIVFQMDGLSYTLASTSAFLTQCYCFLIPLWVALVGRRWPSARILFCIALVLVGMAVLVDLDPRSLRLGRGEIETLIASVLFTGQILALEHPRYRANRPACFTTVMLLGAGALALPMVCVTAPGAGACVRAFASLPVCGLMLVIILLCTLGSFILMNRWQRHVTATEAGLIYCSEPLFVCLLSLFLPGLLSLWAGVDYPDERVTLRLLAGGGLITAANVLLLSRWLEPRPAAPAGA